MYHGCLTNCLAMKQKVIFPSINKGNSILTDYYTRFMRKVFGDRKGHFGTQSSSSVIEDRSLTQEFREMSKLSWERPVVSVVVAVGNGSVLHAAPQSSITLEFNHLQHGVCEHNSSQTKWAFSFDKKIQLPFLLHGQPSRSTPSYWVNNTDFSRKCVFQRQYRNLFISLMLSIQKATEVEDEMDSEI